MSGSNDCITPQGFARLNAELKQLWEGERPQVVRTVSWAAGNGDRSENGDYLYGKKRLRQIDGRVRFLRKRLESVTVVDPSRQVERDRVLFGATVRYERENGQVQTVTIVGRDETDPGRGLISMDSPIGRALLKRRVGDLVAVRTPGGEDELEILNISYPPST
ncbi:MAG: transcription elongation factor GreB [Alphaproteobacteria bacterium]|nr:transcription elongation factor GreB [Alphaproteobacteria bacterium]MBF0252126.1 transcription elongation factor GreB [Alphaproteobacteria bacterium]